MTDTPNPIPPATDAKTSGPGVRQAIGEAYETSSDIVGAMYETAVEAIKERPVAAAVIGAGVAATVAGAAYGATKLTKKRSDNDA
jgi:hypothetical protein